MDTLKIKTKMTSLKMLWRTILIFIAFALLSGCDLLKLGSDDTNSQIPPIIYKENPDFIKGSVIVDSFIDRTWKESSFRPIPTLKNNGLNWVRVGVTTVSSPQLAAADPSTWSQETTPWDNSFWSCREVAGQILKEAKDLGCRLDVFLFLSHEAAYAFKQTLPPAWDPNKLDTEVFNSAKATAEYFSSLGLTIDVYEIGNEIEFGILGHVVPSGSDINVKGWLEDNYWSAEIQLIKSAIAGLRAAGSTAEIGLHIAGLGYSPNNDVAKRFFTYMKEQGVQYDIAELSYPYMFGESEPVNQPYFIQPEFYQTLDYLKNTLGKKVFIAEFSYPAHPAGISKTPDDSYLYTEDGQRDFIEQFLKVVQSYADGAFYFYPDYYPGCNYTSGGDDQLESSGLFFDKDTANKGVEKFQ